MIVLKHAIKSATLESTDIADSATSVQNALQQYNVTLQNLVAVQSLKDQTESNLKQKKDDVKKWLSSTNNWEAHRKQRENRVPNTGLWFVNQREFRDWINGIDQVLIGHGDGMFFNH